jgi:hypothetical protein
VTHITGNPQCYGHAHEQSEFRRKLAGIDPSPENGLALTAVWILSFVYVKIESLLKRQPSIRDVSPPCPGTLNTRNLIQQAPYTSLIEFIMSELE